MSIAMEACRHPVLIMIAICLIFQDADTGMQETSLVEEVADPETDIQESTPQVVEQDEEVLLCAHCDTYRM